MSGSKRFNPPPPPLSVYLTAAPLTFLDFGLGIYFVYLSLSLILAIVPFSTTFLRGYFLFFFFI
jgi:hypothetical protein